MGSTTISVDISTYDWLSIVFPSTTDSTNLSTSDWFSVSISHKSKSDCLLSIAVLYSSDWLTLSEVSSTQPYGSVSFPMTHFLSDVTRNFF